MTSRENDKDRIEKKKSSFSIDKRLTERMPIMKVTAPSKRDGSMKVKKLDND